MNLEFNLRFPTPEQVIVRLIEDDDHDESEPLSFHGPLAVPDQQDLHWYKEALISAELLGDMLNRQKVSLIVLSACQSAKVGGDDPLGSVAARLNHAGIPEAMRRLIELRAKAFVGDVENDSGEVWNADTL